MANQLKAELSQLMTAARADTLKLFDLVNESHLHQSPGFGFRPIIWHLAHIGVFEAYWLVQKMQREAPLDERYERIFDPINTPREESKNLPSRSEMETFLALARSRAFEYLDKANFDASDDLLRDAYVFRLVLEHEYQHQETLLYLLNMLDPGLKSRPMSESDPDRGAVLNAPLAAGGMASINAGPFEMGSVWDAFAYDNELPSHVVDVSEFKFARLLTTSADYAHFIDEGGYTRQELWSDEGWQWRERENWTAPLYWKRNGKEWSTQTLFDEAVWQPNHPVTGVSWYEADAYARFMGKRLPTEAEWEKAASWDSKLNHKRRYAWGDEDPTTELCNFDKRFWGTTQVGSFPNGANSYGILDITGNVWEWTSDAFDAYPGFKYFPYPEYSELWFDGDHRVLKGGSWATRAPLLRTSFRNFFRRQFRIGFAGIRLAGDV